MPEVEKVEGEEISREGANSPGWKTSLGRNKNARIGTPVSAGNASHVGSNKRRRTAAAQGAMKRLAAASRLPRLPREHIRIIVRPRDGLDVRKTEGDIVCPNVAQNIVVISTRATKNANAYAGIQQIRISEGSYKLQTMIINQRNPKALEAKRIKKITTVVVLFDGMKVANYVMCGVSLLRCTLYKRQTDVCYTVANAPRRGRSVTPAGRRRGHSRGRSHSRVRIQEESTWADRVKRKQAAPPPKRERQQMPPPGEAQARSSKRRASQPEGEGDPMETDS
ncbi:hypothetical protein HPB48_012750 [Haemaphysalis longicornis]|uniref:Uncharacterized protein n=1 Tax=Haemaphysalis longicornis TaxID=44386 RepID=A0A9J6GCN0_HAELO|nr:hypothetical protein HPB48_012750 [Haemaphysalis longicornis]